MRFLTTLLLTVFLSSLASSALAGEPTAADLKKQGDKAMQALHYRDAIDAYNKAYAIGHEPAILYNRARAQQGLGDYPAALDSIEEFVRVAPEDLRRRVPQLAELVDDIRAHVGLIVVTTAVTGATVSLDGRPVGTTPLSAPLRVGAGPVAIGVEAPGYKPFREQITTVGGKITTVNAALVSESAGNQEAPPPHMVSYVPSGWRVAAFVTGGLGIASLAAGGVFGGLVVSKTTEADPNCPAKQCNPTGWAAISDAQTFATISTITFIAGGVLVAGSAALFLFAPHAMRKMAIVPLVGPGLAGIRGVF